MLASGEANAADVTMELGKSLPVLGDVFKLGENINGLFNDQKEVIAENNKAQAAYEDTMKRIKSLDEQRLRIAKQHVEVMRSMKEESALIGVKDPMRSLMLQRDEYIKRLNDAFGKTGLSGLSDSDQKRFADLQRRRGELQAEMPSRGGLKSAEQFAQEMADQANRDMKTTGWTAWHFEQEGVDRFETQTRKVQKAAEELGLVNRELDRMRKLMGEGGNFALAEAAQAKTNQLKKSLETLATSAGKSLSESKWLQSLSTLAYGARDNIALNDKVAKELMPDVDRQVRQFGMTDAEKKIDDAKSRGLFGEALQRYAQQVMTLDKLAKDEEAKASAKADSERKAADKAQQLAAALDDLKTPAQKLDEQIQSFADALAEGKISGDQYDDLVAKARGDFEGDANLPSLVIAGSAEAQMLRWQGQGQSLEREHLEVAKRTNEGVAGLNRTADRIERALADQESYETTDLPGLA
jgi:hypothetical protein